MIWGYHHFRKPPCGEWWWWMNGFPVRIGFEPMGVGVQPTGCDACFGRSGGAPALVGKPWTPCCSSAGRGGWEEGNTAWEEGTTCSNRKIDLLFMGGFKQHEPPIESQWLRLCSLSLSYWDWDDYEYVYLYILYICIPWLFIISCPLVCLVHHPGTNNPGWQVVSHFSKRIGEERFRFCSPQLLMLRNPAPVDR